MTRYIKNALSLFALFSVSVAHSFEMNDEMEAYLDEARLIEGGFPSGLSEDMNLPFADYMGEHWKEIVNHVGQIAPKAREQAIISVSAELMPSHEYLNFVMAFLKKCEEGVVHRSVVANRTLSPGALRYGFFEYNFDHPKVREILLYGRKLFADDQQLSQRLDDILSGVGKQRVEDWFSMTGKATPELLDRNSDFAEHSSPKEQALIVPTKEEIKEIEEVASPEDPAEVVDVEALEKDVELSLNWWLWLIGAVVIVVGIFVLRSRK